MTTTSRGAATNSNPAGRFGTFGGVFTPNVLTILGIILFLRTGWVVGQAGLVGALVIVLVANLISLLTGLSLAAIATSMEVKSGGNYYIISRSLGLEIGGAIGIPLYLSQAISVAFYIIGFTEALRSVAFFAPMNPQLIATGVVLVFGVISFIGADIALKIQYFILAILIAALVSFFSGGWGESLPAAMSPSYSTGVTFWAVFAVFFPAVTGIEVGTSMSGDLKNPSRSIPVGTIASIAVTAVIYIAAVYWLATHATQQQLVEDRLVMQRIASVPLLILLGVLAATLSSALGSIIAAPRTLRAIALDRVVPARLASQMGSPTEPRAAVLMTTGIAVAVIWMGDLNFVAPIITMFFLNTYGMTNLVAGIERLVGNPSFRPRFKVHWAVSILGALGCYGAMFLINPLATIGAVIVSYGIFFYLERRAVRTTWGDLRSGIWFTIARYALLNLESQSFHVKNWRPNLLVFTGQPHNREELVAVAEWLSLGRGIVTFFQLLVGDVNEISGKQLRRTARRHIREYIQSRQMTAFAEVEVVDDFFRGAITVAQAHGIGGLEPNTVLLGWSRDPERRVSQIALLRTFNRLQKSVLFLKLDPEQGFGNQQRLDVWWGGRGGNADLMLIMAHLIRQHRRWDRAEIRLIRVIDREEGRTATREHMEKLLSSVRVVAEPTILVRERPNQPIAELAIPLSREADLTLLGMNVPEEGEEPAYGEALGLLLDVMGTVLLVRSAQTEDLLDPAT